MDKMTLRPVRYPTKIFCVFVCMMNVRVIDIMMCTISTSFWFLSSKNAVLIVPFVIQQPLGLLLDALPLSVLIFATIL